MSSSTHTLRPVLPPRPTPEARYRAVLQEIATGNPRSGRPLASSETQQMARRVLVEMGDDWIKQEKTASKLDAGIAFRSAEGDRE